MTAFVSSLILYLFSFSLHRMQETYLLATCAWYVHKVKGSVKSEYLVRTILFLLLSHLPFPSAFTLVNGVVYQRTLATIKDK